MYFLLFLIPSAVFGQNLDSIEISIRENVAYLTDPARLGRGAGSPQELEVARYLYGKLADAGVTMLSPLDGEDFYIAVQGDTIHSRNVIGIVGGYDPQLRDEYVVVGAHYDHLGTSVLKKDGKDQLQIYYGQMTMLPVWQPCWRWPNRFLPRIIFSDVL